MIEKLFIPGFLFAWTFKVLHMYLSTLGIVVYVTISVVSDDFYLYRILPITRW